MKLDKHIVHRGQYKEVTFEIIETPASEYHKDMGHSVCWCHYIYLRIDDQIPDKELAEKFWLEPREERGRIHYDYYSSIINEIEFHGGCTFYSKETSEDQKKRVVKIGCDYQHLWDEGKDYSLDYVVREAKETIDSLLKLTPINKWCSWCGAYEPEENHLKSGRCVSCKDKE